MFLIFCLKIVGVKAARKMLVKLTTGRRTRKYISWGLIETIQKDTTVPYDGFNPVLRITSTFWAMQFQYYDLINKRIGCTKTLVLPHCDLSTK